MKREGLWEKLRLLNPKNLQREVHVYGYRFSWKTHLMAVIAALAFLVRWIWKTNSRSD